MRGQQALEYLMAFGWAVVIVSIVGITLWKFGVYHPMKKEMVISQPNYFDILSFSLEDDILKLELFNSRLGSEAKIIKIELTGSINAERSYSKVLSQDSSKSFLVFLPEICSKGKLYFFNVKIFFLKRELKNFSKMEFIDVGKIQAICKRKYRYRREVILQQNSGDDLEDYQVVLFLNTTEYILQGKMRENCSDIRFTDSDGRKILKHWIEPNTCNTSNTKIFVKVPSIPNGIKKKIYMYYGNLDAPSRSNVEGTFLRVITGLVASWHLDEGSGRKVFDSSGNNYDGNIYLNDYSWSEGKYGNSVYLRKADISFGNILTDVFSSLDYTIEFWINMYNETGINGNPGVILQKFRSYLFVNKGEFLIFTNGTFCTWTNCTNFGPIPLRNWTHVVISMKRGNVSIYLNGRLNATGTGHSSIPSAYFLTIGYWWLGNKFYYLNGKIDEVKVYNWSLDEEDIKILYENYGYTTENYPGRVLVKKIVIPEPSITFGNEEILEVD